MNAKRSRKHSHRQPPRAMRCLYPVAVSKDERDMVASVIEGQGKVLVHGVAIAPGKPTIIGQCRGKPVIGLPGHPASAFIVLLAIVRHLITGMTGEIGNRERTTQATLAENVPSGTGTGRLRPRPGERWMATPVFGKSGLLNTLVRSTGVVRVPGECEGLKTGTKSR